MTLKRTLVRHRTACATALSMLSLLLLVRGWNALKGSGGVARSSRVLYLPHVRRGLPPGTVNALNALRRSSHYVPPVFDENLINKWGLQQAPCGSDHFLIAKTGMADGWICTQDGEQRVLRAMDAVLERGCAGGRGGLVLDIGSNSGFYGLAAAGRGCGVALFDMQPACNRVVNSAIMASGFIERAVVMGMGVSDVHDSLAVESRGTCDLPSGRFPLTTQEASSNRDHGHMVDVAMAPLTSVLPPTTDIVAVKIDTEGNEHRVLAGMLPLFRRRRVHHVFVEVTPGHGVWEARGVSAADVAAVMQEVAACGYSFEPLFESVDGAALGSDPRRVYSFFVKRNFEQGDFMISRV